MPKQYEKVGGGAPHAARAPHAQTPWAAFPLAVQLPLCFGDARSTLTFNPACAPPAPWCPLQVDEEMDELALLWDEDLAMMDPDALPRRLITDFSIYNAEVRRRRARMIWP